MKPRSREQSTEGETETKTKGKKEKKKKKPRSKGKFRRREGEKEKKKFVSEIDSERCVSLSEVRPWAWVVRLWEWDKEVWGSEMRRERVSFSLGLVLKPWMKYKKKRVDWNLKFEITVGPKTFEIGDRTIENRWLMGKLTERPIFPMVHELYYLNNVSFFILPVLFLLVRITSLAWWSCNPGLGKNFPLSSVSQSIFVDHVLWIPEHI